MDLINVNVTKSSIFIPLTKVKQDDLLSVQKTWMPLVNLIIENILQSFSSSILFPVANGTIGGVGGRMAHMPFFEKDMMWAIFSV